MENYKRFLVDRRKRIAERLHWFLGTDNAGAGLELRINPLPADRVRAEQSRAGDWQ